MERSKILLYINVIFAGGSLIFDDEQASVELHAQYILIMDGGLLQVLTLVKSFLKGGCDYLVSVKHRISGEYGRLICDYSC